jgi:non-canonical (house-cleaning) NTP pyrophosphatase
MEVVAGSASAIKLEALRQVFPEATVSGVDVVSAVPPQPVGRLQTEEGE